MPEWKKGGQDDTWERKRRGIKGKRGVDRTIKLQSGQQWEKKSGVCGVSYPWSSSWIWCHDSLSLILLWNAPGVLMKCVCFVCVCRRKSVWKCIHAVSVLCGFDFFIISVGGSGDGSFCGSVHYFGPDGNNSITAIYFYEILYKYTKS